MSIAKLLKVGLARYKVKNKSVAKSPRTISKHAKAKTRPKNYHAKRKAQRKETELARRQNR